MSPTYPSPPHTHMHSCRFNLDYYSLSRSRWMCCVHYENHRYQLCLCLWSMKSPLSPYTFLCSSCLTPIPTYHFGYFSGCWISVLNIIPDEDFDLRTVRPSNCSASAAGAKLLLQSWTTVHVAPFPDLRQFPQTPLYCEPSDGIAIQCAYMPFPSRHFAHLKSCPFSGHMSGSSALSPLLKQAPIVWMMKESISRGSYRPLENFESIFFTQPLLRSTLSRRNSNLSIVACWSVVEQWGRS